MLEPQPEAKCPPGHHSRLVRNQLSLDCSRTQRAKRRLGHGDRSILRKRQSPGVRREWKLTQKKRGKQRELQQLQ
jgi:hypothetical protein